MLYDIKELYGSLPPEPPWGKGAPDIAIVQKSVQNGGEHVPQPYRRAFVEPLLEKLEARVLSCYHSKPSRLEAFTGAIYQHDRNYPNAKGYPHAGPLRQILAVVSDFYESFLENAGREKRGFQILERYPPLATFSYSGKTPFTIPVDDVDKTIGGSVAIVSLPAVFAKYPILWALVAHETGGHDVAHAIPGLLNELEAGLEDQFAGMSVPGLWPGELASLWSCWMDEAVADAYAVLNIGPMFGASVAAYVAALREKLTPNLPPSKVDMVSGNADAHPIDILRIHLVLGAVESLSRLDETKRQKYVTDLKELADLCRSGDTVAISGYPLWRGRPVTAVMPLAQMQESARRVGRYIARAKLKTLGGLCIQEVETWDDDDEKAAAEVRDALARGASIEAPPDDVGPGRTAHVFAGALMHLLQAPPKDNYDTIHRALSDAFDKRFGGNPLWQNVETNRMGVRT